MDYSDLFHICEQHNYLLPEAVIPQPYIPYFPATLASWNGILLLAEAQNLGVAASDYRCHLETAHNEGRHLELWDRLNHQTFWDGENIGIGPWDDGTMKLTLAALRGVNVLDYVAVSNAVIWSACKGGATEHLIPEMITASIDFWKDTLRILKPKEVITFGPKAKHVMLKAGFSKQQIIDLPGAFMRKLNMGFRMDINRLLKAFPEVENALDAAHGRFMIKNKALAIHCACASVSHILALGKYQE